MPRLEPPRGHRRVSRTAIALPQPPNLCFGLREQERAPGLEHEDAAALDEGATEDPPPEALEQTKGPRIFMQDDDSEFNDLDSDEDPDDDLDIKVHKVNLQN